MRVETGGSCGDDDVCMDSYRWAAMWDAHAENAFVSRAGRWVCQGRGGWGGWDLRFEDPRGMRGKELGRLGMLEKKSIKGRRVSWA